MIRNWTFGFSARFMALNRKMVKVEIIISNTVTHTHTRVYIHKHTHTHHKRCFAHATRQCEVTLVF